MNPDDLIVLGLLANGGREVRPPWMLASEALIDMWSRRSRRQSAWTAYVLTLGS